MANAKKKRNKGKGSNLPSQEVETLNKNELRTRSTRLLLLQAAEDIFARDGFEKADLNEIAKRARRTKGSIYAHFKNKEDLFLAIVQHRTTQYTKELQEEWDRSVGSKQKLEVVREFYGRMIFEKRYLLLTMEFKLYAIRNPRSKKKLQQLYQEWYPRDERHFTEVMGSAPDPALRSLKSSAAFLFIRSVLSSVAVEREFAPDLFDDKLSKTLVFRITDSLLGTGQR